MRKSIFFLLSLIMVLSCDKEVEKKVAFKLEPIFNHDMGDFHHDLWKHGQDIFFAFMNTVIVGEWHLGNFTVKDTISLPNERGVINGIIPQEPNNSRFIVLSSEGFWILNSSKPYYGHFRSNPYQLCSVGYTRGGAAFYGEHILVGGDEGLQYFSEDSFGKYRNDNFRGESMGHEVLCNTPIVSIVFKTINNVLFGFALADRDTLIVIKGFDQKELQLEKINLMSKRFYRTDVLSDSKRNTIYIVSTDSVYTIGVEKPLEPQITKRFGVYKNTSPFQRKRLNNNFIISGSHGFSEFINVSNPNNPIMYSVKDDNRFFESVRIEWPYIFMINESSGFWVYKIQDIR